jgi:general transcription factor 3C polypeptide 3 (transcription factor C subunit 4)
MARSSQRALPFYISPQVRDHHTLSYGDPQGGSYPEPDELLPEDDLGYSELDDPRSPVVAPAEDLSSDHGFDEGGDGYLSEALDQLDQNDFPSSDSDGELGPARRGPARGRGRGRRQALSAREPATAQPSQKRSHSEAFPKRQKTARRKNAAKSKNAKTPQEAAEFRRLNGLVTSAWVTHDYDTALRYALDAVRIDPQQFALHATIAEIHMLHSRPKDAAGALFVGVQSSTEVENWWYVVDRLKEIGDSTKETRRQLVYCYSKIIQINNGDYQARVGRMRTYKEQGLHTRAIRDCQMLIRENPADVDILCELAVLAIAAQQPDEALSAFDAFFLDRVGKESPVETLITWELTATYLDLLGEAGRLEESIAWLKTTSRWLLGRGIQSFWDTCSDDREWDVEHKPRRVKIKEFKPGAFDNSTYGLALPIEFRVRLGTSRLLLGPDHYDEAMVSAMIPQSPARTRTGADLTRNTLIFCILRT